MKRVCVFTPTFNRKHLLTSLYESLKSQSNGDFTWLVVDDGSTDFTSDLIQGFIKEDVIDILYEKKCNGGVHTAANLACQRLSSELIIPVYSDCTLQPTAIEVILRDWDNQCEENSVGLMYHYLNSSTNT